MDAVFLPLAGCCEASVLWITLVCGLLKTEITAQKRHVSYMDSFSTAGRLASIRRALMCGAALACVCVPCGVAQAKEIVPQERLSLARSFVEKIKSGFEKADSFLGYSLGSDEAQQSLNTLPEGEPLLFQVQLSESRLSIVGGILTEYSQGKLLASLRDFIDTLDFPIEVSDDGSSAAGWYIKQDQNFVLDMEARQVNSELGEFDISAQAEVRDGDVFVPLDELGSWFGITSKVNTASLFLMIESEQPLPLQERIDRRNRDIVKTEKPPVRFEQVAKDYEIASIPYVDISTSNSFSRNKERGSKSSSSRYNVRSSGDFLKGTLETNLSGAKDRGLENARFNYSKTSLEPELLGSLNARKYELGDIVATRLPLTGGSSLEVGARVTNRDPLLSTIFPTTQITGDATPGWDVELYREGSFVGFQSIDDDGFYNFEDVRLFRGDNSFKLVFYGLQGQVEEKIIEIPVNADQLNDQGGVYDVSITASDSQILDLSEVSVASPDENEPHLVARYERPIGDNSAIGVGFRSRPEDGVRHNYLQGSVSTVIGPSLLNLDMAVNDEGHGAAETTLRRNFGEGHEFNSGVFVATDDYTPNAASGDNVIVRANGTLTGPLKALGEKSRYSVFSNYTRSTDDSTALSLGASSTNRIGRTALNQGFRYQSNSQDGVSTDEITGTTLISRYVAGNNLRFVTDYQVKPETELETLRASVTRVISADLDGFAEARRDIEEKFTTGTVGLNWNTDYARISPQVSYDTDGTLSALLSTTSGISPNPNGGADFSSRNITRLGGVSAFVFVDDNGNGAFDEGEQPIENATINAVQGGRQAVSDSGGVAFISQLRENTLTDIVLEPETLQDPFWIPGRENVSVRPRPGYVAKLNFPVLNAGEMDGFVYANLPDGTQRALRGVTLKLYDETGKVHKASTTGGDGFYLFSLIKPGKYVLIADGDTLPKAVLPAKPQNVEIGYDGTIIYGNEVYLDTFGGEAEDVGAMSVTVLRDLDGYLAEQEHLNIELGANDKVILNLGSYKSRLMMALKWYLLKSRYAGVLQGVDSVVSPSDSLASPKTGVHELRATFNGQSFDDAYKRCTALAARGFTCAVEILPHGLAAAPEGSQDDNAGKTAMLSGDKSETP